MEELATVFNGGGRTGHSDELRAMIVHELVLAGHDVLDHPAVGRWARLDHWLHHGLGWLPLVLADFEKPDPRSERFDQGWEALIADKSVDAVGSNLEMVETTTVDFTDRAGLPFAHWAEHSNGKIDAHEYLAADTVRDKDLRGLLARAAPVFLASGEVSVLRAIPATLGQVWTRLHEAGSGSSFYGPRQGGAYGRLHAWQSIAALTGALTTATPGDVANLARRFISCRERLGLPWDLGPVRASKSPAEDGRQGGRPWWGSSPVRTTAVVRSFRITAESGRHSLARSEVVTRDRPCAIAAARRLRVPGGGPCHPSAQEQKVDTGWTPRS